MLYQELIRKYGRDFTPYDVSRMWLDSQPKNAYCTAERVAFINFVKGFTPPASAVHKNPYREWIGAQIRADYFGYINPGRPEAAAEMAWRDACVSHVKNGIYGGGGAAGPGRAHRQRGGRALRLAEVHPARLPPDEAPDRGHPRL